MKRILVLNWWLLRSRDCFFFFFFFFFCRDSKYFYMILAFLASYILYILQGMGRAFCAGGDVASVTQLIGAGSCPSAIFTEMYELNWLLAELWALCWWKLMVDLLRVVSWNLKSFLSYAFMIQDIGALAQSFLEKNSPWTMWWPHIRNLRSIIPLQHIWYNQLFINTDFAPDLFFGVLHVASFQVSFLNGIVMGGGAGVSIHGRFRISTEKSVLCYLKP